MKRIGSPVVLLMAGALLLVGCATGTDGGSGKRYGLTDLEVYEAIERGEGRQALAYYEARATELERGGTLSKAEAAKAYAAAAIVAAQLGAYQKGIRYGLRALEILDTFSEYFDVLLGKMRLRGYLGYTYSVAGDFQEARRQFEAGLELANRFKDPYTPLTGSSMLRTGLAGLAYIQGDYGGAIEDGRQAIRSLEDFFVKWELTRQWNRQYNEVRERNLRGMATALLIVGRAEWELKKLDDAEASLRRAIEIGKEIGAYQGEIIARAALAEVAYSRGDIFRAETEAKEARVESQRLGLSFFTTFILSRGAVRLAEQGRHAEALDRYQEAMRLVEEARSGLQEAGLRSLFLEDKQAIYHGAVRSALALEKPEEAFSYGERGRARAFLDLLGNQTVLSKGKTRALVEEEVRLRARLSEAQALAQDVLGVGDPTRARQQVEAAEREYRAFLDRVRKENLEQASLMTVEPVTLAEVQQLLPEGTTLLEYLVMDPETVLWVVDRHRVEVLRLPVARAALLSHVREFRQAIAEQAPLEQIQRLARQIYARLLAPARPHIRGAHLLVVPHDALHYLPFSALRTPEGRWLVEDYTLATLPSASVLKFLQNKGQNASSRALALGNPDLGLALNLRYAEREARAVGERFPGATVLVRSEATETRVKRFSPEAGILHFATHGELSERDPLSSALLLVPEGTEDGRLEVRELFGLDLNARLVVLSACETGLGKLSRGDELVGLQRAFLYAGTPAVVTTLWKVDDRASFLLMREFYEGLQSRGPADALRHAQRRAMQEFPHPFFWAAFGLTGVPK